MGAVIATAKEEKEGWLSYPLRKAVVDIPVIALYGARTIGKDTITEAMRRQNPHVEKVETDVVWRKQRANEDLALASGVSEKTLDDLFGSQDNKDNGYVVSYAEENVLYSVPARSFRENKIPVLHVVGPRGLEALEFEKTLPNKLNILVGLNLTRKTADQDIENRVVDRLIAGEELPREFSVEKATNEQRARIKERTEYTRDRLSYFMGQPYVKYHAAYDNSTLSHEVMVPIFEHVRDSDIVTGGIASRILALFKRYTDTLKSGVLSQDVEISGLHDQYIQDVCIHLFGRKPGQLRQNLKFADTVLKYGVEKYADDKGLTLNGIRSIVENAAIAEYSGPRGTGRFSVYLLKHEKRPVLVSDVVRQIPTADFHILGVISEAVFYETKTWPRYDVKNGVINGILFSLTDSKPFGQKSRQRHELFIGYR